MKRCESCKGKGALPGDRPCSCIGCGGTGKPPGMDHNCIGIGCRWAGCENCIPPPPPPDCPGKIGALRCDLIFAHAGPCKPDPRAAAEAAEAAGDWPEAVRRWRGVLTAAGRQSDKRHAAGRLAAAQVRAAAKGGKR
jgi:hypothetical protein